ncbi:MAG: hypothetical protein QM504_16675 [Pseudomonadota bacterium]
MNATGDGLITSDTEIGLEWLDLTETVNMSYDDISSQFGTGGKFEGWRYASASEVINLWANFGLDLSGIQNTSYSGYDSKVIDAANILGRTYSSLGVPYAVEGITNTVIDGYYYVTMGASLFNGSFNSKLTYLYGEQNGNLASHQSSVRMGSYLVRTSPVPIPSTVWLFGSGLVSLIGIARRTTGDRPRF